MGLVPERTRVLYIAGSGHTGSTLLALLLDSHPQIACVGETSVKPTIVSRGRGADQRCSCGSLISECTFWTHVFDLVRLDGHAFGPENWTNDYRFKNPIAQRLLSRACTSDSGRAFVKWAADHLPAYRQAVKRTDAVNVSFIKSVLAASHAQVFADTSKRLPRLIHLLRLPELDVKLVLLVRDVRGYAASAKRRHIPVADAARTWLRDQVAMSEVADSLGPDRVHRLRYEDVCGEPVATLRRLWAFCGVADVPPPEFVDAATHHILGNSMRLGGQIRIRLDQSWKDRLDGDETRAVLAIAGHLNRTLGYA